MDNLPDIPGYEVGGLLGFGAGGSARSVRGRDGRALAAVVVPRDERAARLGLLRDLHHPHLPRVHDLVPVGDEEVAVVMDLVVGPSLATLVNARSWLTAAEVAQLWRAVSDALAALHARGLVHGDVSPANIVIGPDGAVLIDVVGHGGAERGHTGFIPPELDEGPATTASDVWSLARTLGWASGDDATVTRCLGAALAPDPPERPSARDFGTWAFLLGVGTAIAVPGAADLAGAQLRAAAAPTLLRAPAPRRASRGLGAVAAGVALLLTVLVVMAILRPSGAGTLRGVAPVEVPGQAEARAAVAGLLSARDAALVDLDDGALARIHVPGSPSGETDARLLAGMRAEGVHLASYATQVLGFDLEEASVRGFRARVVLRQLEHQRAAAGTARVVEPQEAHCVVLNVRDTDGWRIERIDPCGAGV